MYSCRPIYCPATVAALPPSSAAVWAKATRSDSYRLQIDLDQHFHAKVFTSGSPVSGQVIIHALRDILFDEFEISLLGVSTTQNFLQQESGVVAMPFLRLVMPIPRRSIPANKMLVAGQDYSFPFNFVIPSHLTIGSCRHKCNTPAVKEQHLRPPPTMGFWEANDQSPQMTQIKYAITVVATRTSRAEYQHVRVLQGSRMIRVLPAFPEDAPLDITSLDDRYVLSKEKTIRKNFVASKLGRLTATAAQPKAIMLSSDGHVVSGTSCRLNLKFTSASGRIPPPKLNSVTGKLTTHTYFDLSFMNRLPDLGNHRSFEVMAPYQYSTSTKLFNLPVGDISWREHETEHHWQDTSEQFSEPLLGHSPWTQSDTAANHRRRRSSAATCPERSSTATHSRTYSSKIDVQFALPHTAKKMYLPTFHSCRISRTYTLELCLSVGQTFTTMSLMIPVQIGVEGMRREGEEVEDDNGQASIRGPADGRRNTYAGLPGFMLMELSDSEPPSYS